MVRALTGCPLVRQLATDCNGFPYTFDSQGESSEYKKWIADTCEGDEGSETYEWDVGIAP